MKQKMKFKIFINPLLALFAVLFISSCMKTDDHKTYSAAEERLLRNAYLDSLIARGHNIDTTAAGVYYVLIEEGEGDYAKFGDTLTVGYAGWFIDGFMFDASDIHYPDGKMEFILGVNRMIPGWEDGLKVMNKESRVQFIIPSELAYGSEGVGKKIPPYQTLIFMIKLFDIKPS
jgi:FKBP-type peptidyl-prolyl cis-trans isomerase FkpA